MPWFGEGFVPNINKLYMKLLERIMELMLVIWFRVRENINNFKKGYI